MAGPRVSSGTDSKQDYATPLEFILAVERRFGPLAFDLAAHAGNTKHARYYSPTPDPAAVACDSFKQPWHRAAPGGLLWLNPEFRDIAPWAAKCAAEARAGARIAMLATASVGTNWFRDSVAPFAEVHLLNGRISFDGENLYPKDCLLALYGNGAAGMRIWEWRRDRMHTEWAVTSATPLALAV